MINRLPIIGSPITGNDIWRALKSMKTAQGGEEFRAAFSEFTQARHVYGANSGISSFYIILEAIKRLSSGKEVILPAYTAGSLAVAVKKAGLTPVLCDISMEDFNLDINSLPGAISKNTLAVAGVHSFGINIKDIKDARKKIPDNIFFIEDCAQSMGTKVEERQAGSFGDVSFFSFNRGKNLPICGGGCIATNSGKIAAVIEEEVKGLGSEGLLSDIISLSAVLCFSLAVNPVIYGAGFCFISRFKDNAPPEDFKVGQMNGFQAALGLGLMRRREELFSVRYKNGMYLINGLKDIERIILPSIQKHAYPVFNRLPVVFKDSSQRLIAQEKLWKCGVETSPMYSKPLHHMFDLGYKKEDFPNANYFAERVLALPVHQAVKQDTLSRIIDVIRQI